MLRFTLGVETHSFFSRHSDIRRRLIVEGVNESSVLCLIHFYNDKYYLMNKFLGNSSFTQHKADLHRMALAFLLIDNLMDLVNSQHMTRNRDLSEGWQEDKTTTVIFSCYLAD
jgi:hypothetical protein